MKLNLQVLVLLIFVWSCEETSQMRAERSSFYSEEPEPAASPDTSVGDDSEIEKEGLADDDAVSAPAVSLLPSCADLKDDYFQSQPTTCGIEEDLCTQHQLQVAPIFSDRMVLQRGERTIVWGEGYPEEFITVKLGDREACGLTDENGRWEVKFNPLVAGGPFDLFVEGDEERNTLEIKDILVGDVWISSGQSNMVWPLSKSIGGIQTVNNIDLSNLRFYNVGTNKSRMPLQNLVKSSSQGWRTANSDNRKALLEFSAVAFFFGRKIHQDTGIPIGLINSSSGGTRVEPWTPEKDRDSVDSVLYNAMIHPLVPMAIKGFIWYQGESNAQQGVQYQFLFEKLVNNWRSRFKNPELPFYYSQLAAFSQRDFTGVKRAQSNVLKSTKNTGMAVITDVSTLRDIHPPNKKPVGERLALWALAKDYNQSDIVYSRSVPKSLAIRGNKAVITFDHVGSGLKSRDNKPLSFFEVAGSKNGPYYPASVIDIAVDQLIIACDLVARPAVIRFGWSSAAIPNLVNSAGLPASVFQISK